MAVYQGQYTTPRYGEEQYERAYQKWSGLESKYSDLITPMVSEMKGYLPELKGTTDMYKPGGEAYKYLMGEGARDIGYESARRIASGMSGLQHGATVGAEQRKLRTNVMLTTAGLAQQALQPYLQLSQTIGAMVQGLAPLMSAMPNYAQSIKLGQPSITSMKKMQLGTR